jgi:riboflavin transporter FmnP
LGIQNKEGIKMNKKMSTNTLIKMSVLSAIAVILMYLDFPILPAFPFLKVDLSDVAALIGALAFGPLAGVVIEAIKNVLILLVKGTTSIGIGELANFIIGISIVIPAGFIYGRNRTRKAAIIGLLAGTVTMSLVGVLANYFIFIPMYKEFMPALKTSAGIVEYLTYAIVPFNLIKGVIVSVATVLLYKYVEVFIVNEKPNLTFSNKDKKTA